MDKKYIVKNCPAYNPKYCDCKNTKEIACLYRTNCLIKQVIEECKRYEDMSSCYDCIWGNGVAKEILQLFKIEDVNNDN